MTLSFRPLDGESISKPSGSSIPYWQTKGFRPLDGESISKLQLLGIYQTLIEFSFRPLDGESISKRKNILAVYGGVRLGFPSPRRGINF